MAKHFFNQILRYKRKTKILQNKYRDFSFLLKIIILLIFYTKSKFERALTSGWIPAATVVDCSHGKKEERNGGNMRERKSRRVCERERGKRMYGCVWGWVRKSNWESKRECLGLTDYFLSQRKVWLLNQKVFLHFVL